MIRLDAWIGNLSSNTVGNTLFGGNGADRFVLGNGSGNAYGNGENSALIRDFIGGDDYIQLKDWGSGPSDYRVDASAETDYTHQLFDTHGKRCTGGQHQLQRHQSNKRPSRKQSSLCRLSGIQQ